MLILVKLVLPTTFSSPTGMVHWFGDKVPGVITEAASIPEKIASFIQGIKPVNKTTPYGTEIFIRPLPVISPPHVADASAEFTVEASPATAPVSWKGFALLAWLTAVTAMLLFLIRRMFLLRSVLTKSKNPSESMVDTLKRCRKQMGVHRTIFMRISRIDAGPSVCGLFRPTILIPQNLLHRLKREDLRTILLHELAHIKRGDLWISLIQTILQIVYFYNPLLWVANVIIRKVREQAVDEMVLVAMGEKAEDYPQSLLNISRMSFSRPALNLRLIGVSESKKALERRIINMLNRPVPKSSKLGICGLIAIVVIGAVILPMHYDEQNALAAPLNEGRSPGGTIVPGERVGDYTFDMTKDEILERLGKPKAIFYGDNRYTLDNLPRKYFMHFGDVSFHIVDDSVKGITAISPSYKFAQGVRVGDSEQKIKEAFGSDFHIKESKWKDFLYYKAKGLMFEIHKQDRTVMEINVSPIEGSKPYKKAPGADNIIIPGLRVGEYTFDMTKDDILERLGKPRKIFYGDQRYTLDNLPRRYFMSYGYISFMMKDGFVKGITALSPSYKLPNGVRIGDSEQKVKEAFGGDFEIEETKWKDFLSYEDKGLMFEINKQDRTVMEINVSPIEGARSYKKAPGVDRIIIPGLRVGEYTFNMTKDDVLERLGKPEMIFYGDNQYTFDNLPRHYYMSFGDIAFRIHNDSVKEITVINPSYRLPNGLRVGDSEQKVKEAFGNDFRIKEGGRKDFLSYRDKGLMFEIHKKNRTILEINVYPIPGSESYKKAYIPPTSYINDQGRLVDKTDYPFFNDSKVIGGWKSVDFVREIEQFNPAKKYWKGKIWLNHLIFEEGGNIARSGLNWTKGLVLSDDTASKYIIKEMDGSTYMFYEWKSGDYTIRYMKPAYYVLRKVSVESLKREPMFGKKAHIPPTSTINEQGRIVDKIDYPFINDSKVIGTWKSVDFVREMDEFKPGKKQWGAGDLYLKELIFLPDGKTFKPWWTWTKGMVFHSGSKTASKYTLKDIGGSTYMFFEWKSGDYTIRYMKPAYYILKKVSSETARLKPGIGKKSYIPATSTINEKGHIVDKIDYPFVDDPHVIGAWESVDYVDEMEQFKPGRRNRRGNLFLNEMKFEKNGTLTCKNDKVPTGYDRTWTKGLVISDNKTKTASRYTIKEIDGSTYLFYEWKSGDYTFRHSKPTYYVLKKVLS
jgi:beta-lactamase regulating signal transducer with metallopeptidase domain